MCYNVTTKTNKDVEMRNTKYETPELMHVSVSSEDIISTSAGIGVETPIRPGGDPIWDLNQEIPH